MRSKSPMTEGMEAREAGHGILSCPYIEGSIERRLWLGGWRMAWGNREGTKENYGRHENHSRER